MIYKNRVICDVCGRQIVSYKANEERIVGCLKDAILLDINKHACPVCKKDPLLRQQEGIE